MFPLLILVSDFSIPFSIYKSKKKITVLLTTKYNLYHKYLYGDIMLDLTEEAPHF